MLYTLLYYKATIVFGITCSSVVIQYCYKTKQIPQWMIFSAKTNAKFLLIRKIRKRLEDNKKDFTAEATKPRIHWWIKRIRTVGLFDVN